MTDTVKKVRYSFVVDHARRYGDREAVFLYNLCFWLKRNRKRDHNYVWSDTLEDFRYWSYNTVTEFATLFDFWTVDQIRTIIKSLRKQNVIVGESLCANGTDRTLWFALVDERLMDDVPDEKEESAVHEFETRKVPSENSQMHLGKKPKGAGEIPNAGVKPPKTYRGADSKRSDSKLSDSKLANASGVTLNVEPEPIKRFSLSRAHAEAVDEAVRLTADEKSRLRFAQLYRLVDENNLNDQWAALIASIKAKQRSGWKPVGTLGGYFNGAVKNILEASGVYVPVGSSGERTETRNAILESMGGAE